MSEKEVIKKNPTGVRKYPLSPCAVGLTKNADPDRYSCSGYGIGSDSCSSKGLGLKMLLFLEETIVYQSLLITRKNILVLGDDTLITAEAQYSINFTEKRKRFVLSLHYNGSNSFWFVNGAKIHQFRAISVVFRKYFKRFYRE